jgi:alcohol dehydrogenase (cytochrome c)
MKPFIILLSSLLFQIIPAVAQAQLDPAVILKPLADQWTTYSGDYSGKRYSSLTKINASTLKNLGLAWVTRFTTGCGPTGVSTAGGGGGFGGRFGGETAAPIIIGGFGKGDLNNCSGARLGGGILMVDGVIYMSSPDNAWAVDARDGTILWHYYWKTRGGTHTGNRGMGMWHNNLYLEVHDNYLICLDAKTGKEKWKKEISSFDQQYFSSVAPIIIGDHVIAGTGNDMDAPGFLQSFDPETGERQWIFYTVPMTADDPAVKTWASLDAARHGGGQPWIPGAYDPETHLYMFGTGNPTPAYTTGRGEGDNLYTCSLVAVNIDTGKMAWYYQTSPHDTHDWDSTQTPVLADMPFNGRTRKIVMTGERNGYFFVLDRTTGEHLITGKFGLYNNWASSLDEKGRPKRNPAKDATIPGSLVNGDVTNYPPPSFSPQTGLFYVPERNSLRISYLIDPDPRGSMGLGGTMGGGGVNYGSYIDAIDYHTGEVVWRRENDGSAGLLTTASGLLFSGDGQNLVAYEAATGKPLWHSRIGATGNAPETYLLDGKQYVLATGGDQLFAFVLNQ